MTQYSKFNVIYRLQKWMDSVPGQTFLNYAYSWGASIVILGTLFKLTHLPGANFFLFLGMGTEVFVFFLSAFDRPFDKTADGMELPTHVGGVTSTADKIDIPEEAEQLQPAAIIGGGAPVIEGGTPVVGGGTSVVGGGGTIIIGGGTGGGTNATGSQAAASATETEEVSPVRVNTEAVAAVSSSVATMAGTSGGQQLPKMDPELEQATTDYVTELKRLTEMLSKVAEQSEKLGRNSEEMDNLDRTLTGICKVYEMQLKSASSQIGTIDEINEQTKKMAKQIEELNRIYTRMIEAMTVNMPAGAVRPQV